MGKNNSLMQRQQRVSELAAVVRDICIQPVINREQFDTNAAISVANAAASNQLVVEAIGSKEKAGEVMVAWSKAMVDYHDTFGELPSNDVMATALESVLGMNGEMSTSFESVSSEKGIETRTRTAAIILPTLLMSATTDAAVFIGGGHDKQEIFDVTRIAKVGMGKVAAGTVIEGDMPQSYGSMRQTEKLETVKGETLVAVCTQGTALPTASESLAVNQIKNHNPQDCPVKPDSISIMFDGQVVATSYNSNDSILSGRIGTGASQCIISPSSKQDLDKGIIGFNITGTVPDGIFIISYELDLEVMSKKKMAIPEIGFEVKSQVITSSQSVISSGQSVQAYWTMKREYGLDLQSMNNTEMRNTLVKDADTMSMHHMLNATERKKIEQFDVTPATGQRLTEAYEPLKILFKKAEQGISTATRGKSVLAGAYVGQDVALLLQHLTSLFEPAPVQYGVGIKFIGTFMGKYKIYEVPDTFKDIGFDENQILFYAKGTGFGNGGLLRGDAVPATLYSDTVGKQLYQQDTVWKKDFNCLNPYNGASYFKRYKIVH